MLKEGDRAPDFNLPTDEGSSLKLSDLRGKIVVLYFYPKDDTSGCTKEAVQFNEALDEFSRLGAEVIGVSPDSIASHAKFKAKHKLNLKLLSDEEKRVLHEYGVWVEKKMYGRTYMGVERSTFLIDTGGKIVRMWRKVRVPGHAGEVLDAVKKLRGD